MQNPILPTFNLKLEDLEGFLEASEQKQLLSKQTNKTIIWANGVKKTDLAFIYLHGFSASRREIDPLPTLVASELGANLFYARYTGHGLEGGGDAFKNVTDHHWYTDTLEALAIGMFLGKKVVIMGHSTGCTFGTWLAYHFPQYIEAQLYLSPNYLPADKGIMLIAGPCGKSLLKLIKGNYNTFKDREMISEAEPIWSISQHIDAIVAMVKAVAVVQNLPFETMKTPLFIACSPYDKVVRTSYTQKIFNRYGSTRKELVLIENSQSATQHTITGDARDPSTIPLLKEFFTRGITKGMNR